MFSIRVKPNYIFCWSFDFWSVYISGASTNMGLPSLMSIFAGNVSLYRIYMF